MLTNAFGQLSVVFTAQKFPSEQLISSVFLHCALWGQRDEDHRHIYFGLALGPGGILELKTVSIRMLNIVDDQCVSNMESQGSGRAQPHKIYVTYFMCKWDVKYCEPQGGL